ncbi:MAG: hypothetical protein IPG72_05270 [Ardenticatenales bacterium]|jgi:hypothetical protein|nr:hypothetical protein [Ardenticatenales bacterium]
MVPIEYVAVLFVGAFGVVGVARKFPRELGATIVYAAMMLMLSLGGDALGTLVYDSFKGLGLASQTNVDLFKWFVMMAIITGFVIINYAGQTLSFQGKWPPNPATGLIFDLLIGLFNGWLVVWTAWKVTHDLGYPNTAFGGFQLPITARADHWVQLAPLALIPDRLETWVLAGFLILLIGLRVVR